MKLYFTQNSPYARRARLAARCSGLDIEEVDVGSMRAGGGETMKQHGPGAKVPGLLTDGGVFLCETLIITGYICAKSTVSLMPSDDRMLEIEGIGQLLTDALFVRNGERQRTESAPSTTVIERETARISGCYDLLDDRLSGQRAEMTLAHFSAVASLGYADWRGADDNWRDGRAGLSTWFDAMHENTDVAATAPVF